MANNITLPYTYSMQDWLDSISMKDRKASYCECGADKVNQGPYGHSTWCPIFIAPIPINDKCDCGGGSWHSINCKFRLPEPQVLESDDVRNRRIMKHAIDLLNKESYSKRK